jgi:hypothetical protein
MKTTRGTWVHGYELPASSVLGFGIFEEIDWRFEKPHKSPARREAILMASSVSDFDNTLLNQNGSAILELNY